jgi:hypothetical protein
MDNRRRRNEAGIGWNRLRVLFPSVSQLYEGSGLLDAGSRDVPRRIGWLRSEAQTCRASAVIVVGIEGVVGLESRRNLLDTAQLYDLMADEAEAELRNR